MIKEIKFTDNALKQIGNLLSKKDKGSFFRIAIKGGGCSGFQYEFTFDQSKNDDDLNYENILIDKTSADLLKGSEVDYVRTSLLCSWGCCHHDFSSTRAIGCS